MLWALIYIIFRPFIRKAAQERKRLATQQRVARHTAIDRERRGREYIRTHPITDADREYMRRHAPGADRTS